MSLAGKVAIITGSSSGIGEATAILLASEGCKVTLAARRADKLAAVAKKIEAAGGTALVIQTDVTKVDDIKRMIDLTVAKFGKLDILFNNAGIEGQVFFPSPEGLPSVPDEDVLAINAVNMTAPTLCAKYAIAAMQKNGDAGGIVIGNSSISSAMPLEFSGMFPIYHPTKAYMDGICRMIAMAHPTIKSYNVNPLGTQTELWERAFDSAPPYARAMLEAQGATTKEAWAQGFNGCMTNTQDGFSPVMMPIDVAKIVLACADGSTKYVTGDCIASLPGFSCHQKHISKIQYTGAFGAAVVSLENPAGLENMNDYAGNAAGQGVSAAAAAPAAAPAAAAQATTTTTITTSGANGTTTETVTTTN